MKKKKKNLLKKTANKYELKIGVIKPFGNLYRKRHVLILCKDIDGKIILGGKEEYPEGICRLLGGGVEENESYENAAVRELGEEIGVDLDPKKLIPMALIDVRAMDGSKIYSMATMLYFVQLNNNNIKAGDDVTDLLRYDEEQFSELIERFKNLKEDFWYKNEFSWHDYGKVYGFIHEVALKELRARNL